MQLGEERIPPGEEEAIRRVVAASEGMYDRSARPARRGQHPKHHGCLRAEFEVLRDLPEEYRVGLFAEARTYPAWVRFSNGGRTDDRKPDAHGMAVKVMGVPGEKVLEAERHAGTQDFVMIDHPVFFIRDAIEYAAFSAAMMKARGARFSWRRTALFFLPGPLRALVVMSTGYFLPGRLGQLGILRAFAGKRIGSPLRTRFWGTTPYAFGEGRAAKFSLRPAEEGPYEVPEGAGPDFLRGAMADHLDRAGAAFDFLVQLQADAATMPVEDPTVPWDERKAPWVRVARLRIPPQEFDTAERDDFGEHLSFTPWHALPEHRPLGGINRTRRRVYLALSRLRHDLNDAPMAEPAPEVSPDPAPGLEHRPEPYGPPDEDEPVSARESTTAAGVIADELAAIRKRRAWTHGFEDDEPPYVPPRQADADRRLTAARKEALKQHLVGLSFSGGGIRAGTFAVGFLQGLSSLRLLKRVDYLSTVSGGGYAGAWLAAWLKRDGDVANVERQLDPNRVQQARAERDNLDRRQVVDEEPEPLFHLREYSSYMTARPGTLTADTWSVIAIWTRNVAINLMMLLPMTMVVVLLARMIVYLYQHVSINAIELFAHPPDPTRPGDWWPHWPYLAGVLALAAGLVASVRSAAAALDGDPRRRTKVRGVLGSALLVAGAAAVAWTLWRSPPELQWQWGLFAPGLAGLAAGIALNSVALGEFRTRAGTGRHYRQEDVAKRPRGVDKMLKLGVALEVVAAVLLTIPLRAVIWLMGEAGGGPPAAPSTWAGRLGQSLFSTLPFRVWRTLLNSDPGLLAPANLLAHAAVLGGALGLGALFFNLYNRTLYFNADRRDVGVKLRGLRLFYKRYVRSALAYVGAAFAAGATCGLLLTLLEWLTKALVDTGGPGLAPTFVPPLALLILVAGFNVEVALLGRQITEAEREWWSRVSAQLLIWGIYWVLAVGTVVYVPALFLWAPGPLKVLLTSGWIGATATGILAGRRGSRKASAEGGGGGNTLALVTSLLPPVFLIGLVGLVSLLVAALVNAPKPSLSAGAAGYFAGVSGTPLLALGFGLVGSYAAYWAASQFIDVNLFSLNAMYANRLIRCYLGASRPKRGWRARWGAGRDPRVGGGAPSLREPIPLAPGELQPQARNPNPATGFDLSDDIPIYDLQIGAEREGRTYWGPHLLINTTLNLVAGDELAYRDRKGEAFVITPLHCGSKGLGYAPVVEATRDNLTLGRAITISGAAVDPNMKFYQSAALTAFLTIFNARLGYWMQSPLYQGWRADGPQFGDRLWVELFGQTDGTDKYVHLSDGGHFENLGVYELVRRRCRYIIALDAGEDADPANDNLADLIRLCRIDFGVRIEVDTRPFQVQGPDKLTRAHVSIGRVRYDDTDNGQMPGILVYVKISLTGDEPPDLLKYAKKDPRFPHQPTDLRQAFDEEQFECYRALGEHIAREVFAVTAAPGAARDALHERPVDLRGYRRGNQHIFSAVRARWAQPPSRYDDGYERSAREWSRMVRDVGARPQLRRLANALYPESEGTPPAERQAVARMLLVMESAWIDLGLKVQRDLPADRGRMNAFRRWANTDAFRRHWPTLRTEFSPDFVEFCEQQLHLAVAEPVLVRVPRGYSPGLSFEGYSLGELTEEFAREWPELARPSRPGAPRRGLEERLEEAHALNPDGDPLAWLAVEAPAGHGPADRSPERFAGGVFVVSDYVEWQEPEGASVLAPPPADTFELLAWVRRPRRSAGLGSRFFETVLDEAKAHLRARYPGRPLALRVRYPKPIAGPHPEPVLDMWRSFFALYDFEPLPPSREATETVMVHRF